MPEDLSGRIVAILATDGFEQSELLEPRKALDEAGATTRVVSPAGSDGSRIRGWNHGEWGREVEVDVRLEDAAPQDFDALVLPGGVMNPDRLRMNEGAVDFVRAFFASGKAVAAICHGPWMVVEAGAADGRRMTSWPSLRSDIRNAGGQWVDQEVVVDNGLVTSRKPDDLPAFVRKAIEEIHEGAHVGQSV